MLTVQAQRVSTATAAEHMLAQLESSRLLVTLAAAPDPRHSGHKVRVVEQRNPPWYRRLCAEYLTRRTRPRRRLDKYVDTRIKRRHVRRALFEISRGGALTEYARRVLPYVEACAAWLQDPYSDSPLFEEEL